MIVCKHIEQLLALFNNNFNNYLLLYILQHNQTDIQTIHPSNYTNNLDKMLLILRTITPNTYKYPCTTSKQHIYDFTENVHY